MEELVENESYQNCPLEDKQVEPRKLLMVFAQRLEARKNRRRVAEVQLASIHAIAANNAAIPYCYAWVSSGCRKNGKLG